MRGLAGGGFDSRAGKYGGRVRLPAGERGLVPSRMLAMRFSRNARTTRKPFQD